MTSADEFKGKGNAALQSGNYSLAIEHYTSAINLDGSKHVYYSNRSAAYLSKGDAENALEDAGSCLGLNPEFTKGYSRKGAALHSLKRYNDSIAIYEEGLIKFPSDKGLQSGLESVKKEKDRPMYGSGSSTAPASPGMGLPPGMGNLFGPDMMSRIAMDPKLRGYMSDPDFMEKIQLLQKDPNQLSSMMGDQKIMDVFMAMLGANGLDMKTSDNFEDELKQKDTPVATKIEEVYEEPEPMEEELPELSPAESKKREDQKAALKAKENGNELYKAKKFEEALAAYDEAVELDPTCMTFLSNKAAVYLTMKKYDDCIKMCTDAVEVGKVNRAPFEDRAKALTRCARAYQKKGDLGTAIEMCKLSKIESFSKDNERLLKTMELDKRKADVAAYQDDEKAEEAKQRGNTHFRNKEWGDAVGAYEEAVKRAPKIATTRNNLAAALCKVMDFNGAKRQIEAALEIDPKYVKALARKGDIEVLMKENHKAMESYRAGLAIEPDNAACTEGLRKVSTMVNSKMSEEERKERAAHAMADPEIQSILQDPVMMQVLRDFQENPAAANQAMSDPSVRVKLEKLIASGVVQTS